MRKRALWLAVAVILLFIGVIVLRSPRLPPDDVLVTDALIANDTLEIEYRMNKPFRVCVQHWSGKPGEVPNVPGIHVGGSQVTKKESAASMSSRYDWLRGEYVLRLRISTRDNVLRAGTDDKMTDIPIWCGKAVQEVKFIPKGRGTTLGNSSGMKVVEIDAGVGEKELLNVYAGTETERYCR